MRTAKTEYVILFHPENCTQCHGCEIACKSWRNLEYGVRYRRVLNIWQGEYPALRSMSLSLACLHCVEPACAEACPAAAISRQEQDGLILVDEELCTGCGLCGEACMFGIPQYGTKGIMQKCDLCRLRLPVDCVPPCVDTCPGGALSYQQVSQHEKRGIEQETARLLATTDRSS